MYPRYGYTLGDAIMRKLSGIFVLLFIAITCTGWVLNIMSLISNIGNNEVTTLFVIKCIGIFVFPLGAVLGYIT